MAATLWVVTLAFVGLTLIDPRKFWYSTSAWQYKNPEANEPSEASFVVGRVVTGMAAVMFGVGAIVASLNAVAPLTQEQLDSAGADAALELNGSYYQFGAPGVGGITEALHRDDVAVSEGRRVTEDDHEFGESYRIENYYEIQGIEDDSIIGCMEISYVGGLFHEGDVDVSAHYNSGPC